MSSTELDPTTARLIEAALALCSPDGFQWSSPSLAKLQMRCDDFRAAHPTPAVEAEALTEARVREMINDSVRAHLTGWHKGWPGTPAIDADAKAQKGGAS